MNSRRKWMPNTLRYRLFIAFITLLLIPLCIAISYLFQHFESIREQDMIERMSERMEQVNVSLTDMMAFAYKASIMLSQDESMIQLLHKPDKYEPLQRKKWIESKMSAINNTFFFHQAELYFRIIDREGNVYTSYAPKSRLLNEQDELHNWYQILRPGGKHYKWIADDVNDVQDSQGNKLLSLYMILDDELRGNYGLARISIDVQEWFTHASKISAAEQGLTIFTGKGEIALQSDQLSLRFEEMDNIISAQASKGHYKDLETNTLVHYSYVEELDWYVVSQMPLSELLQEIERLRTMIYLFLGILVIVFVAVTFILASRITRPINLLKRSMEEATDKKLNVKIVIDHQATDEIRSLSKSFNNMLDDVFTLIAKLKQEESQKQEVRFQNLLYQMNPHFLLNTLNTVKWMARKEKQPDIVAICMSLGLILEANLNTEIELIPLQDELKLLQSYEAIQAFRFKDQFTIHYIAEEQVKYALVPKLSLQPLVENSIVHGFNTREGTGMIIVRAKAEATELVLEVEDNGIGLEAAERQPNRRIGHGIGLSNLRERLQLLFKEAGKLEAISAEQGTVIRIRLPLLIAAPYSQKGDIIDVDDFTSGR